MSSVQRSTKMVLLGEVMVNLAEYADVLKPSKSDPPTQGEALAHCCIERANMAGEGGAARIMPPERTEKTFSPCQRREGFFRCDTGKGRASRYGGGYVRSW
jgi:hypothetical protein